MSWVSTIWKFLTGGNIVSQGFIPQEIIKAFAKKLDDMVNFEVVFKGKLAFMEKYDAWFFEQAITGLLALLGAKIGAKVIKLFENTMIGFNTDNFELAKKSSTELLAKIVDIKKLDNNIETMVVASQVELTFSILDYYLDKKLGNA